MAARVREPVRCPRCTSALVETTLITSYDRVGPYDDDNRAHCTVCKHHGTVGDWQRLLEAAKAFANLNTLALGVVGAPKPDDKRSPLQRLGMELLALRRAGLKAADAIKDYLSQAWSGPTGVDGLRAAQDELRASIYMPPPPPTGTGVLEATDG